jgi:hypothetical protein
MLIVVAVIAATLVAQQPTPKRDVRDPGVVATGQRITPAGVQTVFDGRVGGVRFGETSDEVWAAVPGSVYRLAWRANRVLARARVDGRTGIYSLGIDPATHRVLASSVGRLPVIGAAPPGRRPSVAQLSIFDANASGDSASAKFNSGALGDYMAGAPAVAARSGADGRRLAVVPLPANDSLVVLDAESGARLRAIALGVEPIAAVISADSRVAYVSVLGGPKPKAGTTRRASVLSSARRAGARRLARNRARGQREPNRTRRRAR